mmetsp:Transcript_11132/g.36638  ORF Transcript_11132/g.36638 Transcript_11132/m.36638 type:complete len:140 (+) Transcript_11132:2075-2494(+)
MRVNSQIRPFLMARTSPLLREASFAVVGRSANKIVPQLQSALLGAGKRVARVDPRSDGSEAGVFKSISDAPRCDIINLCCAPPLGMKVIEEAAALGCYKGVFVQPGAGSQELEELCAQRGLTVYNGCVLVELQVPNIDE